MELKFSIKTTDTPNHPIYHIATVSAIVLGIVCVVFFLVQQHYTISAKIENEITEINASYSNNIDY